MNRALDRLTANASEFAYKKGDLVFGETQGALLGLGTDRHAVTVASSRSGKGVGVIIPNLKLWPHNALVIDPKGEAAEATYADRKKLGHNVYVLDPFKRAKVPAAVRARYNPLDELDLNSPTIREDIETISDGIVMRPDPKASHWDDGAVALISGLIAYVLQTKPKDRQNLPEVRSYLRSQDRLGEAYEVMKTLEGCGGLAEAGAAALDAKESSYYISNADKNTRWLDSEPMREVLSGSSFSMNDLKAKKITVFLVLPANYLGQHGRFLRLFVRCGIDAMARVDKGEKCLFMLDEFFALGYIDEIAKATGLMAGYGLQMWVFLQNLGQLTDLYGRDGTQNFFGNADLHQFFGSMDGETLDFTSQRLGAYTESDLPDAPPMPGGGHVWTHGSTGDAQIQANIDHARMASARHQMQKAYTEHEKMAGRLIGRPRFSADQLAHIVRKPAPDQIAVGQIVFTHGLKPVYCQLSPFWELDKLLKSKPSVVDLNAEPDAPEEKPLKQRWWESDDKFRDRREKQRNGGHDIYTFRGRRAYMKDPKTVPHSDWVKQKYADDVSEVRKVTRQFLSWGAGLSLFAAFFLYLVYFGNP